MGGLRVEFAGVSKRFGRKTVLAGVSGAVERGRVLVVTGPNGSGKSTLLNILAGLMRPTQGVVRYHQNGHELPRSAWRHVLGVCAPDMAVYEELSALENLELFASLRGLALSESALSELFVRLGLSPSDLRRPVGQFSSGMLQRVKLAQALVHRPEVLLLDEPSSNLDRTGHHVLAEVVAEMKERAAVVVATNDPREVAWGDETLELGP
ncbi:MAG: ABC transporter ATP-binding protein [Thermoanaerobaculum sp.]